MPHELIPQKLITLGYFTVIGGGVLFENPLPKMTRTIRKTRYGRTTTPYSTFCTTVHLGFYHLKQGQPRVINSDNNQI